MSVPPEIFGEDYLHFYSQLFDADQSDADASVVARLLVLQPGMRVLDVPSGEGRIAARLARLGCEVVGVESSERMLELGRQRYPEVSFVRGDMRELKYDGEFDAVLNWFTSFGYFDPATNDTVLQAFARALRPGGRLLLEMHNPWRLRRLVALAGGSSSYVVERGEDLMVDRVSYDVEAGRSRTERFVVRDGRVRRSEFSLEQVPAPALVARLRRAGFGTVELFGAGGERFDPEGRRLLALAHLDGPAAEPPVSLRELDEDNVEAVCALRLAPGQERYVAPSANTVAECRFDSRAWLRAIYAGDAPVGVTALIVEPGEPRYFLVRFMIAAEHQGRGYGRAALALLREHVRALPGAHALETSCVPGPESPAGFYRAAGFRDTGRVWHGEDVLTLTL